MRKAFATMIFALVLPPMQAAFAEPIACFKAMSQNETAPKVVVISGTNRAGSNSLKVANTMAQQLIEAGANVEVLNLADVPVETYSSDGYFNSTAEFKNKFENKIAAASNVVVVIPEYNGSFPGILKTFFDYVNTPLTGKKFSLIGISAGKWGGRTAVMGFSETLSHRKADISGSTRINIENVDKSVSETAVTDPEILKRMQAAAREIVTASKPVGNANAISVEKLQKMAGLQTLAHYRLNSLVTVHGELTNVIADSQKQAAYLQFKGPTELQANGGVLPGQGLDVHHAGFGTPVGKLRDGRSLSQATSEHDLAGFGLVENQVVELEFASGVKVQGTFQKATFQNKMMEVLTFQNCKVTFGDQVLFDPAWGQFDMAVGEFVRDITLI